MPNINFQKCFHFSQGEAPKYSGEVVPDTFLNQLAEYCAQSINSDVSIVRIRFQIHAGYNATYKLRSLLLEVLKEIYVRWTDTTNNVLNDSDKAAIASKLIEGASNCTPGFHDRCNDVINSFYIPGSIDSLLSQIRKSIVDRTARNTTNDVHAHNRFFVLAEQLGLGVKPINSQDIYSGDVSNDIISNKLLDAFHKHYRPFMILKQLGDWIKSTLCDKHNYVGAKKHPGYLYGEYSKWLTYLEKIFEKEEVNDYLLIDDNDCVVDLNWPKINLDLFQKLVVDYYLYVSDAEFTCMNNILQAELPVKEPVKEYGSSPEENKIDVSPLVAPQGFIQTTSDLIDFLSYFNSLSVELKFQLTKEHINRWSDSSVLPAFAKVMKAQASDEKFVSLTKRLMLEEYSAAFKTLSEELENSIIYEIKNNITLTTCLSLLELLDGDLQNKILTRQYAYGNNILTYAASYKNDLLGDLIERCRFLDNKNKVSILSQRNQQGYTALMYAIKNHPEQAPRLFSLVNGLPTDQQATILMQTNKIGESALIYAAIHDYKMTTSILDVMDSLSEEEQYEILKIRSNKLGSNALTSACIHRHQAVAPLLKTIQKQDKAHQATLLTETIRLPNNNKSNALRFPAEYQPKAVVPLMEAIVDLSLSYTESGIDAKLLVFNTLSITYRHYHEELDSIMASICNMPEEVWTYLFSQPLTQQIIASAKFSETTITAMLALIKKLPTEKQIIMLYKRWHNGNNCLKTHVEQNSDNLGMSIEFLNKTPQHLLKNLLALDSYEFANIIKSMSESNNLQQIAITRGSYWLPDFLAKQSHLDKQKAVRFQITKFIFSLCRYQGHDKDEQIRKDFQQLITIANTHRSFLGRGTTKYCQELIEKLSNIDKPEKEKLNKALSLNISEENLASSECFKKELKNYIKGTHDSSKQDYNGTPSTLKGPF